MRIRKLFFISFVVIFNVVCIFNAGIKNVQAELLLNINYPTNGSMATSTDWALNFSYTANEANQCSYSWATSTVDTDKHWRTAVMSADGQKMVAFAETNGNSGTDDYQGNIYTSSDGGLTWISSADIGTSSKYWYESDISDDGDIVYVVDYNSSSLYKSSDQGVSFSLKNSFGGTGPHVTTSGDGSIVYSAVESYSDNNDIRYGNLYKSSDFGSTWATTTPVGKVGWTSINTSQNGQKVIATKNNKGNGGYVYTSSNGGTSWATSTSAGEKVWIDSAISDDGLVMYAVAQNTLFYSPTYEGYIYVSLDGGTTWASSTVPGKIREIKTSQNGQKSVVVNSDNYIYTSDDFGQTWVQDTNLVTYYGAYGYGLALSADGTKILLASLGDLLRVSDDFGVNFRDDGLVFQNYTNFTSCNSTDSIVPPQFGLVGLSIRGVDGVSTTTKNVTFNHQPPPPEFDARDVLGQPDFTSSDTDVGENSFNYPYGLTVDKVNHRLFVADSGNNRVLVYQLDSRNRITDYSATYVLGQIDFDSDAFNTSTSTLKGPEGLAYDEERQFLFVLEYGNKRVLVFDLSGGISNGMNASYVLGQDNFTSSVSTTTQKGIGGGDALLYDSQNKRLFVDDSGNNRILVFDLSDGITNGMDASYVLGQSDFVSSGYDLTQNSLNYPYGMTYDYENNYLFVVDDGNNRVLVFDLSDGITNGMDASYVLGQPDFTSSDDFVDANTTKWPTSVSYDSVNKRLFVGGWNSRVVIFNLSNGITNGMPAESVIGQINFSNAFDYDPTSSTLDSSEHGMDYDPLTNTLFLTDANNNRVLLWDLVLLNNLTIPSIYVGDNYSLSLLSSVENNQGTINFSVVSGSLPNGLVLSPDGEISGTPTTVGSFSVKIKVTDNVASNQVFSDAKTFTFNVLAVPSENDRSARSSRSSKRVTLEQRIIKLVSSKSYKNAEELAEKFNIDFSKYDNRNKILPKKSEINQGKESSLKFLFLKDLELGMIDKDVVELQKFLNSNGFTISGTGAGSIGNETNYFGPKTRTALINFQIKNGIKPSVGYFGPITRGLINQ